MKYSSSINTKLRCCERTVFIKIINWCQSSWDRFYRSVSLQKMKWTADDRYARKSKQMPFAPKMVYENKSGWLLQLRFEKIHFETEDWTENEGWKFLQLLKQAFIEWALFCVLCDPERIAKDKTYFSLRNECSLSQTSSRHVADL